MSTNQPPLSREQWDQLQPEEQHTIAEQLNVSHWTMTAAKPTSVFTVGFDPDPYLQLFDPGLLLIVMFDERAPQHALKVQVVAPKDATTPARTWVLYDEWLEQQRPEWLARLMLSDDACRSTQPLLDMTYVFSLKCLDHPDPAGIKLHIGNVQTAPDGAIVSLDCTVL